MFRGLREQGVIPADVRFQVSLPFGTSSLSVFKKDWAHDFPIALRAYEDLFAREIKRLTAAIPAGDLAIQWDVCWEVLDIEGVLAWTDGDAWERFAGPVRRITRLIPEETLVGYHLCYGTFPEWPMYEARDMEVLVRMANYAMDHSGRQVDWLHLAGPGTCAARTAASSSRCAACAPRHPRVPRDRPASRRLDGLRRRHETASRYLDDFGVAMYCGFGRQPGQNGTETMREHRDAVQGLLGAAAAAAS